MTCKISRGKFPGRETALLCVLSSGGGGVGLTYLYGLSEICVGTKGYGF